MKECSECERCYQDEVIFCPLDQTPTRLTLPGNQLLANRYFLEKRIGRGAMGQVYLASDKNLRTRQVAVKTIRQDVLSSEDLAEGEAIARFESEALAAASIHHPHVVDVTDFGETTEGVFYLVMEYVAGETLHQLLRREGTLPIRRAVRLLRQIADGVEAAHEAGILHRDLKPANIFIMNKNRVGDDGFVKVGDFGLAKMVNQSVPDSNSDIAASTRGIVGTPEFMSPEQMQPERLVDLRSDVYALGTIAYLMLAGKTPFSGDLMQLVTQKINSRAAALSNIRADIPKAVEAAIMSALETKPENRPPTVEDWISELEEATENIEDGKNTGASKLIILAPMNAEVYLDDERKGSLGNSGRLILAGIPAGKHILRISKTGEKDDERIIEIREDNNDQVIQAQLKSLAETENKPSAQFGSGEAGNPSLMPAVVRCTNCAARFAEGVKFCGRCGNRSFSPIVEEKTPPQLTCPRCSATVSATAKFCGKCGLKIERSPILQPTANVGSNAVSTVDSDGQPEKICQHCGAKFPARIKFCGRCGNRLLSKID